MKILLLSFYFPPDLAAGSFRAKALVDALLARGESDLRIDVITAMPNRYDSLRSAAAEMETGARLRLRRLPVPVHKSGMLDQAMTFAVFARRVLAETRGRNWDVVVATSSRLMTAVLGSCVARRSGALLYLDMRDLFVDTMDDLLSGGVGTAVLPVLRLVERRTFRGADRVNLISPGFLPYARAIAPGHDYRVFTNGIDDEFMEPDPPEIRRIEGPALLLYAGNLGEGQGMHHVVPDAARLLHGRARFRLIGDGGRRGELERAVDGLTNIELLPPVPRSELHDHYREADILFLHLNDHAAFRKVLPSKVFEYAATGKPILAGVAGYAADFLRSEVPGVELFPPCDPEQAARAFDALISRLPAPGRQEFKRKYARRAIMDLMATDVLDLAREARSRTLLARGRAEGRPVRTA